MEPKTTDENKAHDDENKNTSSPIERLHSRDSSSSSSSSIQSSEFEDPSQGEISSKAFSRNKSGNPGEWSMHSNESLFSIKTGTTSFTDHDRVSSVKPADLRAQPTIPEKPADVMDTKQNKSVGSTNQEAKKEVVDRKSNTKSSPNYEEIRQSARNSNASGQSFAFPLLVKDQDGASPQGKPQTPKRITSSNIQIQVENRPTTQSSSSWFTRCFSFCSCRQS